MNRFFECFVFSGSLFIATVTAQQPGGQRFLDLTYERALELALAANFRIQVEEFNPQIADARRLQESGVFDPRIEASITYDENRRDLRTLDPGFQLLESNRFADTSGVVGEAGLVGLTPWGLTYDLGVAVTRTTDDRTPIDERFDSFIGGSIVQPLLRGFGTDVNLAQIRIARADQAISAWSLRQKLIDVITDTAFVYNNLYASIRNLEVEIRSRDLAAQTLQDNRKRAEIGVMTELDVVQALADVAAREERVLVAERLVLDNENFLKQLVTDEVASILDTRVRVEQPPIDLDFAFDLQSDLEAAFDLRPDYRQALLDIQKQNINVIFTRNQALPRLDLVGSLGLNGIDTSLGRSISEIATPSNVAASAGAIFSLPVPNREARGALQISELGTAQALVALKQLEQSIYVETDNAAGQIVTARKRIEATTAARVAAARTLEAAQSRLASGTATTFEVLQFQRDFAEAEISELQAYTDYQNAIAEYARVTGTTLTRYGLELE